jgi:hypothetical protein
MWKSIQNSELNNIDLAIETFTKITEDFVSSHISEKSEDWNVNYDIIKKYLQYLVGMFSLFMDGARKSELEIIQLKITKLIQNILLILIKNGSISEIKILLNFLKETGDKSIGKYPVVFIEVIEYYQSLADNGFEDIEGKNKEWIEEIFRHIGWLGERLLTKTDIEQKPLMRDEQYSNEYDALINVLFSYGYKYNNKYPDKYPLIYFDAISVVFNQLVRIYKEKKDSDIKNRLFDCVYAYSSFAVEAIDVGNTDGASLASMDLRTSYQQLMENGIIDVAKDTIQLIVQVAIKAIDGRSILKKSTTFGEAIEYSLKKTITSSPFTEKIKEEMFERYLKGSGKRIETGSRENVLDYIKELGREMETNFGFMFDWRTGEMYAENDPRRH